MERGYGIILILQKKRNISKGVIVDYMLIHHLQPAHRRDLFIHVQARNDCL